MLDQSLFTETIHEVSEIIRVSQGNMTREEILGYFKDMDLNEEQQNMVLEFLLNPHPEDERIAENAQDAQDDASLSGDGDPDDESNPLYKTEALYDEESVVSGHASANGIQPEIKGDTVKAVKDSNGESTSSDEAEHTGVFQMYLDELNELSTYSKEKQEEMYKALLDGDEGVIADITNCWLPVVLENAKKLTESNDPDSLQDVVQEGNMALFLCLTELCGSHEKVDVESELATEIENAMKSCILEEEGEGESEEAMVGKVALVNEAVKYLEKEKGMKPSVTELAEYTKVPASELDEILLYIEKANQKKK